MVYRFVTDRQVAKRALPREDDIFIVSYPKSGERKPKPESFSFSLWAQRPYLGNFFGWDFFRNVLLLGTHQLNFTWFTYNCCTESYTPQPVDLPPIPQLLPYMQSFFSFGQHVIYQTLQRRYLVYYKYTSILYVIYI